MDPNAKMKNLMEALNVDDLVLAKEEADSLYDWLHEDWLYDEEDFTPEMSPKTFRMIVAYIRNAL